MCDQLSEVEFYVVKQNETEWQFESNSELRGSQRSGDLRMVYEIRPQYQNHFACLWMDLDGKFITGLLELFNSLLQMRQVG